MTTKPPIPHGSLIPRAPFRLGGCWGLAAVRARQGVLELCSALVCCHFGGVPEASSASLVAKGSVGVVASCSSHGAPA